VANLSDDRERLRIAGTDCVSFLQGQSTNDVSRLVPGQSCYAAFLNAKGRMRGEGHIIRLSDMFLMETNSGLASSLEKFVITEDTTIENVSAELREWLVIGEGPTNLPANVVTFSHPLGLGLLSEMSMEETISAQALEILRIEAATPRWGIDMDENTIPNEAGLEKRAISYDKGCYIGQETIARIKTYGHVNRRLVQLAWPGDKLPVRGENIFANGSKIGHVTSMTISARLGKALALGYVRREFAVAGINVELNNHTAEVLRICGE
jgi:folate-binding protein YgfZ